MDPAQALADLMEISSQVDAAVLLGNAGEVTVSSGTADEAGQALAQAARELLEAAADVRAEGAEQAVTQLEAATRGGSVFVVRDGTHVIAATTAASPTVGLVFYDLKTCLRSLAGGGEAKPKARRSKVSNAKAEGGDEAA
ncbi:MAG: hypothetical protein ACRDN6_01335 [Gaiellaceae bacterium]